MFQLYLNKAGEIQTHQQLLPPSKKGEIKAHATQAISLYSGDWAQILTTIPNLRAEDPCPVHW